MGKTSIFIYISIALLLLLLISYTPTKRLNHPHRRLTLRSNFSFTPPLHHHHDRIPFDPLIADLELHREDKQWQKQFIDHSHSDFSSPSNYSPPELEDSISAENYLNDEARFNVTERLVLLFPKIDVHPPDEFVSVDELTEWNLQQIERETMHRTEREMRSYDKNRDGFVSLAEYEPPSWAQEADNDSFGFDIGWWKEEHFNASDADEDGLLNVTEYNEFLHPGESKNPKLLHWLCAEEVRERDTDKDGKLNFKEFFHGLFDLVRDDDERHSSSHQDNIIEEEPAKKLFSDLDKDNDGYLSVTELLPMIGKIHPSERYYAKQQAAYAVSQADTNKDGRLSLSEMIENSFVFYNAVFNEDEDEGDYSYHDEFR